MRALVIAAVAVFVVVFAGAGAVIAAGNHEGANRTLRSDVHLAAAASPSPKASLSPSPKASSEDRDEGNEQSEDANEDDDTNSKSKTGQRRRGDD